MEWENYKVEIFWKVCTPSFFHGALDYFSTFFLHQMTPLHLAAESDRIKMVNYLVEQRADVNIQDHNGVIIFGHTMSLSFLFPGCLV